MMIPPIYTSALIFGPVFLIVLALCLALLARFSSLKGWIGVAMVAIGIIEVSLVPAWVLWVFVIGLSTIIIGVIMLSNAFLPKRERVGIGLIAVAVGIIGILLFAWDLLGFAFGLVTLIFGIAGSAVLLPEQRRVKVGLVSVAVGFVVILVSVYMNFLGLLFFVGLPVVFIGISVGVSGLPYWTRKYSGGNTIWRLRKVLYVLLVIAIFSSALVYSLRTTKALREEFRDDWSWKTTADTTVRGVVTEIYLNHEVNTGYSYHIFPALIIVNVTEVVEVGESWMNLTEESEHWMNENMNVAYDKPDVPSLIVGKRVEARGYFDTPIEDQWAYSYKLVIATEINESYIQPLQGD
ncbi:MAG TPA: hypothetical protein VJL33_07160 [Candidatus Bathyarchaeia archaeon]|nr:hypothetical protein [Candidatus Bathyarchaeia archaeon]